MPTKYHSKTFKNKPLNLVHLFVLHRYPTFQASLKSFVKEFNHLHTKEIKNMKGSNRIYYSSYRKVILSITFYALLLSCFAQKENNMWTFGYRNGLDFNTNPPTHFESEVVLAWEGNSSVSDENGNLLFYTDANAILDVNGNAMPNGNGILGNTCTAFFYDGIFGSAAQGVAIAQKPDNPHQYYVFVAASRENRDWDWQPDGSFSETPGYLRYSIVDMQLNGGLGDVVQGQKNIVIDDDIGENVTVVQGDGCFYWLISHSVGHDFKVYKVDNLGVHQGTHYPGHFSVEHGGGCIRISPDKQKIVHTSHYQEGMNSVPLNTLRFIEIGDFDAANGTISNLQTLQSIAPYSAVFSPNSQLLYTATLHTSEIYQYNLSLLPNLAAVNASEILLTNQGSGEMRNAPDGKIYFTQRFYDPILGNQPRGIGIIHNPNVSGTACNVESSAFAYTDLTTIPASDSLSPSAYVGIGQNAVVIKRDTVVFNHPELVHCTLTPLQLEAPEGFDTYLWNNGSNQQEQEIVASGNYTVSSSNSCNSRIDNYMIKLTEEVMKPEIKADSEELCDGEITELHITTNPSNTILWNTGDTSEDITINKPGIYYVTVENECGTAKDSITINSNCETEVNESVINIPNVFTPNGDGINDLWEVKTSSNFTGIQLHIFNRWGNELFYTEKKDTGWNGTVNGKAASEGVYFYKVSLTDEKQQITHYNGFFHLNR